MTGKDSRIAIRIDITRAGAAVVVNGERANIIILQDGKDGGWSVAIENDPNSLSYGSFPDWDGAVDRALGLALGWATAKSQILLGHFD